MPDLVTGFALVAIVLTIAGLASGFVDRAALEALLLYLIRADKVSVAWAGKRLGLGRQEAIRWYTSHGYPFPDYTDQDLEEDARYAERFGTAS